APEVVDGDDAGVRQARHGPPLALETAQGLPIVHAAADEDLDRDGAAEPQVLGAVDGAHAAAADAPLQAVLAVDGLLDREAELHARPVGGAGLGAGLVAGAADGTLAEGIEARQRRPRPPLLVGDALAERSRLERVADLRAQRAEEPPVTGAVGLARALLAEDDDAAEAVVAAADRDLQRAGEGGRLLVARDPGRPLPVARVARH